MCRHISVVKTGKKAQRKEGGRVSRISTKGPKASPFVMKYRKYGAKSPPTHSMEKEVAFVEHFIQIGIGLLAMAGAVSLGWLFVKWVMRGTRCGVRDVKVIVRMEEPGGEETLEYALRSLLFCTDGIVTKQGAPEIYVVDSGFDEKKRGICRMLASESGRLSLVKEGEFRDFGA